MKPIKIRLPRLGRTGQVIRNILVTLWLIYLFWGSMDYPIPTDDPVLSFRRAEVSNLVGPSEIQYVAPRTAYGKYVVPGTSYGTVGTYMDQVLLQNGEYSLTYFPRDPDGAMLLPLYDTILAVDVPEGTVSAQMELQVSLYYFPVYSSPNPASLGPTFSTLERAAAEHSGEYRQQLESLKHLEDTYWIPGVLHKEGGVTFTPEPKHPGAWDQVLLDDAMRRSLYDETTAEHTMNARLEAVFYNAAGEELGRAELKTPDWT